MGNYWYDLYRRDYYNDASSNIVRVPRGYSPSDFQYREASPCENTPNYRQ